MANPLETTFKNMKADERYKKLARTLKMALLKNAERRNSDGGNTGTWPNVSSINGDHLDTSLAAMSIQSSRVGSEVVSSSANLRNILLHKRHFSSPRNNVATSSENQFPTDKNNDDSAMMPPPPTPGIGFGANKRFSRENQRVPLLNMPLNSGRNSNGFSMSTPASSISSIPKCAGSISINSSTAFQESNTYGRNEYEENVVNSGQKQERNFSRWRVLLNDKAQLIIKGTLECGKVARSKPVIRRLSPTSVQSVFKHTYHLHGNLVDDRGELPDYVRGKFYNGFPDDWENVYQVWRNFVNDGSRLSFHWPTPVTDSDDDIKSGITEITYRQGRYRKSTSPRKRNRSAKSSKLDLTGENDENHPDPRSYDANDHASPQNFDAENHPSPRKLLRSHSKTNRQENPRKADATLEEKQKSHDCTTTSLDSKNSANSLVGYFPEDKLNIIIDNLTNKNCPIEYIQKIVQMFDCMKYVASYPSLENESERGTPISNEKVTPKTPINKNQSNEEKSGGINTSNSRNRVNTPRPSIPKISQHTNELPSGKSDSLTDEKSFRDPGRRTRRQLTNDDYKSSESDDNSCDDTRKTRPKKMSAPERIRKTQKYKNPPDLLSSRQYDALDKLPNVPREQYSEISVTRKQSDDSSSSDEEFIVERIREAKANESKTFLSPRKIGPGKENRKIINHYDSSISITEDEERYTEKPKAKEMRKDNYDSSVSITEDEHADVRNKINAKNYYPEKNARHLEPEKSRDGNSRDDRKKIDLKYYPQTKSRSAGQAINRNEDNRGGKRLDSLDYYSDGNSRHVEENVSRNKDIRDVRKEQDSSDYYSNSHSQLSEQDTRRSGDISEVKKRQESLKYHVEPPQKVQGTIVDFESPENSEIPPPKNKTPQVRKKPIVVSTETVKINLTAHDWQEINCRKDNDNSPRKSVDEQKAISNSDLAEPTKLIETGKPNTRSRESSGALKVQESRLFTTDKKKENIEDPKGNSEGNKPAAEYGSQGNPKLLTAWVPAVICDDDKDRKCHLIFEGKLLNEAGHVANRKFVTDIIRRRLSPSVIETISHEFYKLVGDLNDTKHVVPKELIKLCHNGCPGKIGSFCERWKSLTGEIYKSPPRECTHNTSVDCLGVPMSSRGRRILPPLNYWAGERVVTKDNKTLYSPGISQEGSIPSSLENSTQDVRNKKNSPKTRPQTKKTNESKVSEMKKKDMEKISPTNKSTECPSQARESKKTRAAKRRLTKNVQISSSESDDGAETKPTPRKRKTKVNDKVANTDNVSTRKLRNSTNNPLSPQTIEHASPPKPSFDKSPDPEGKLKLRKRQKIDENQGTLQRFLTKKQPEVKCTFYKNVPIHDGDLSEDQLSTI